MAENDYDYSFHNVRIRVDNVEIPAIAVKHSAERSVQKKFGNSTTPRYRTIGQMDPKGEIKLLKKDADTLTDTLGTKFSSIFGGVFEVSKSTGTGDQAVKTTIYKRCTLMDHQEDWSDGPDNLEVTLPFDCMNITINGYPLMPE